MKNTTIKLCIGLTLAISTATHANWGNSAGMMPFGGQSFSQPMQSFGGSMPFGGMGSMPFSGMSQPQQQYRQPQSSSFMMPGMDQGMRSMMEPGKIMAEEATPGVSMKPTWR